MNIQTDTEDPLTSEISAMESIGKALSSLDEETRQRVLSWATAKFLPSQPLRFKETHALSRIDANEDQESALSSFAELFAAVQPNDNPEKALAAAYWLQVYEGMESFSSQQINTELKNLGHGIPNVTSALSKCLKRQPAEILQLKKSGSSQQARKTYKATTSGLSKIKSMIQNAPEHGAQ